MNRWWNDLVSWWSGGDFLMPVMFLVAVVLYAILAERSLVLWGVRRSVRRDELLAALNREHRHDHNGRWRTWAARYVGLAEAEQLSRGFAICRALTACLPLLGLFGTVTGMIDTFSQLGHPGAQAQHASGGIGLALTSTQYGMGLAIPAVVWQWALANRAEQLAHHRELVMRGDPIGP